ncbi:methyltransferase domain-containing protein [Oculatella sp. LEGE 06141]|nr:methyltransferase domain-containing protein [Oculatella sp. LEGE 06141]
MAELQSKPEAISLLTNTRDITLLKKIETTKLIDDWNTNLRIDITDELKGHKVVYLYQCNQTKLRFFLPLDVAGSSQLYEQLEKFDWYYMPHKWEHDVAIQDLQGCQYILEIGAGRGTFIERLRGDMGIDAQGIELNQSALQYAHERNIPVEQFDLYDFAQQQAGHFDAVCSFQVLEHVSDPKGFLEASIQLLKPGGKLILAVPNFESFPKHYQKNLLDQPPHHITQWCHRTFKSLPSLFPLKIERFRVEPLASYHVDWYIEIQESRLSEHHPLQTLMSRMLHRVVKPILHRSAFVRSLITGHTLYVVFLKLE